MTKMDKMLKQRNPIESSEKNGGISFLDTIRITTTDIDVIASRIAARKLLDLGWEIADLNNLIPFSSLHGVSGDIVQRYSTMGPLNFLKNELKRCKEIVTHTPYENSPIIYTNTGKWQKDPRLMFFHSYVLNGKLNIRVRNVKIRQDIVSLILKMLPKSGKFIPIDYLVLNNEGYLFVELKANKARLSKKQLEVTKMIQHAGYKVAELHVSLTIEPKAEIRCSEVSIVKQHSCTLRIVHPKDSGLVLNPAARIRTLNRK
jgi:VRR-NUC domain